MHPEHFYVLPGNVSRGEVVFDKEEIHHITRVKRKKKGDVVWAVDGEGGAYEVKLTAVSSREARGKILHTRRRLGEPVAEVTLAQGVLKGERFDWLVEKTTEIGIRRIIPMLTETSETLAGPQKLARWKRIAVAALKQSGRSILPEITPAREFHQVMAMGASCQYRLMAACHRTGTSFRLSADSSALTTSRVLLVVGPEGGFTREEMDLAEENGFQLVHLGPRRLRAETAGVVFSTLILANLGELE
jgi:16S rRNA (uracil1498-N3)-methyltransferase